MIKVSIIIPIYNVSKYINKCLISVFNQSYKNIEIILIDDCGTDESMKIAEECIRKYDGVCQIKIIHHIQNKGLSAARNTGIENCTGDYIYFLDSDDTIPTTSIELLVSKIKEFPNVDFVIGGIKTCGSTNYTYPLLSKPFLDNNKKILNDYFSFKWNVMACNKLIRKKFIDKYNLKFLEGFYHEDIDFSFKLAIYAKQMACCYDITYNYLIRKNSITTYKKEKNYNDYFSIISSNLTLLKNKCRKHLSKHSSNYIIENFYILCLDIIREKNPQITYTWKKKKLNEIQRVIKKNNKMFTPSLTYKIKLSLLLLPKVIMLATIKVYLHLKNIH